MAWLTDLLAATDDLIIVGETATAGQALRRIPAAAPDIALLDARLPDGNGIDVCREIRSSHENVRCLILTRRPASTLRESSCLRNGVRLR
ncbi:MAG TPA: response regulator [Propionibacteriaceae bacterium]|nr:response regulator [Propionibacteriaceae bacterium]